MAFNFKPNFGSTTTTTSAGTSFFGGSGGFSSTPASTFGTTTTASSGFGGFSGFGVSSATPAFGTAAATANPAFSGFGASSAPAFGSTAPAFGSTAPAFGSTAPAFGFGATTNTCAAPGFSGFGPNTSSFGNTGYGSTGLTGFGATGTGTAGFGLGSGQTAGFGTSIGQAQQSAIVQTSQVCSAVSSPVLFGDERDAIIVKWNQLQAFWGTGRGYFNHQGHSVEFTPDNPFSFFKAVGYNCLPTVRNEDGLVAVTFDRKMAEICDNQQAIVDALQRIAINNQQPNSNATICVEGIRRLVDDKTEMLIYVQKRANTGVASRIPATEFFCHLCNLQQPLQTQLSISSLMPKTGMTPEQKKLYLDNPPAGIDVRIWEQAKLDNPDPERMIPVPMVGFNELYNRLKHQEQQTGLHQTRLDLLANDITCLQHNQADVMSKVDQYRRNQVLLGHRILKVLVKQEMYRKHGYSIQADDEQLRARLETIFAELSAPMQFKGRLNELMSQMRMQNHIGSSMKPDVSCQIDSVVQQEIKRHLKRQQDGLGHLISIVKCDLEELKVIECGLADSCKVKR